MSIFVKKSKRKEHLKKIQKRDSIIGFLSLIFVVIPVLILVSMTGNFPAVIRRKTAPAYVWIGK